MTTTLSDLPEQVHQLRLVVEQLHHLRVTNQATSELHGTTNPSGTFIELFSSYQEALNNYQTSKPGAKRVDAFVRLLTAELALAGRFRNDCQPVSTGF